jgi:hypothetical protein
MISEYGKYSLVYIANDSLCHTYGGLYEVYPSESFDDKFFVSCNDTCLRWILKTNFITICEYQELVINKILNI